MFRTKRYEYMSFDNILVHAGISNHRPINTEKVAHLEKDIIKNGLLEPLTVWEGLNGDYFLVGGFHRMAAVKSIREKHPDYFNYIDARVVSGELDEMRALNLKLNADRLDMKVTDYFDTVLYLNNSGWSKERIADFLDRSIPWVEEILRIVPGMDFRLRELLEHEEVSWTKAKGICRQVFLVPPEKQKEFTDELIKAVSKSGGRPKSRGRRLSLQKAIKRLTKQLEQHVETNYTVGLDDLLSLFVVLAGKDYTESHLKRVHNKFPGLME